MRKLISIVVVLGFSIFWGVALVNVRKNNCEYYCSSFSGIITKHKLTRQGLHAIQIDHEERWVELVPSIERDVEIFKGDSIVKEAKDLQVFLFRDGNARLITNELAKGKTRLSCRCERDIH